MPTRLPNGRFAKVTILPMARRKEGGLPGMTGRVIVRTNAADAAAQINQLRQRVPAGLMQDAKERAARIQNRLQTETAIAYRAAATGRFSRGIHAGVTTSESGDKAASVIKVTMINYREAEFLTNIGGGGYFKEFPVEPYTIFAKGAEGSINRLNFATGEVTSHKTRRGAKLARARGAGRLKVPKSGTFFTSSRKPGRGGGESRQLSGMPTDLTQENMKNNTGFFYALWTNHPGFDRDVVSEVVMEEGGRYIQEQLGFVSSTTRQFVSTGRQMTVSAEIPIQALTVRLGRQGLQTSFVDVSVLRQISD